MSSKTVLANACFALCSLKSKGNLKIIETSSEDDAQNNDLMKELLNLVSCFRYTIIGNWFKKIASIDQFLFIKSLKDILNSESQLNNEIYELLYASSTSNDSFIKTCNEFKLNADEILFIDLIALEQAEKGKRLFN